MFRDRYWLPRPRFDDGKPVELGDLILTDRGVAKVVGFSVRDDWESWLSLDVLDSDERICKRLDPGECVRRAENDSWERLEADALKSSCGYFNAGVVDCPNCSKRKENILCSRLQTVEIVRRAKKLAGVE